MLSMINQNNQLQNDHAFFIECKRKINNEFQSRNRNKILKRSRQVNKISPTSFNSKEINQEEEEENKVKLFEEMEIENTVSQLKRNDLENLFNSFNDNQKDESDEINNQESIQNIEEQGKEHPKNLPKFQERNAERDNQLSHDGRILKKTNEVKSLRIHPYFMMEISDDITVDHFVTPKLIGKRCLVITKNEITNSKDMNGITIENFQFIFPKNQNFREQQTFYSILDCFFDQKQQTYYITDITIIKDLNLEQKSEDVRFQWLLSNFKTNKLLDISRCNNFKFKVYPKITCSHIGFEEEFQFKFDFLREGILNLKKYIHPKIKTQSNLINYLDPQQKLPFPITELRANALPKVRAYLLCNSNYCLCTFDDYNIYQIDQEERKIYDIFPNMIVIVEIDSIQLSQEQEQYLQELKAYPQKEQIMNDFDMMEEETIRQRKNWVFTELKIVEAFYGASKNSLTLEEMEYYQNYPDTLQKIVFNFQQQSNLRNIQEVQDSIDSIEIEIQENKFE